MLLIRFRSQSLRSHSEKNTTLCYQPPVLPKEMTEVSVMVCHINSPTDFYLQLVSICSFTSFVRFFSKAEDQTQGLALASQVLYY